MSKAPEAARPGSRRGSRGKTRDGSSGRRDATAPASALDEETAAALTLYNTYLVADREQQAHERAVRKAEKVKDDAAAALRKLNDRKAPAAQTNEAEARYREAAEALRRLRDGQAATPKSSDSHTDEAEGEAEATTATADEAEGEAEATTATADEASADEAGT